ncbi:MAG: hypothetical protein CMJ18_16950 [Phycisphaeraceae bacterium]|nr:hypothetical protein [Phycisphaeraceae bacterium]
MINQNRYTFMTGMACCAIAFLVMSASTGHAFVETFEDQSPTTGGWGGDTNWSFSTDAGNPYRANRFRSDIVRALDIIDAASMYTTPNDVSNPNATTTVGSGPSLTGNRVIGDTDIASQGRGMVYHSGTPFTVMSFDWRGFGPATWAQFGNASGSAFGFRLQSQNLEVHTFGDSSEAFWGNFSVPPSVIQDNSNPAVTDWFTLDIRLDHSPYTSPSGVTAPGSFTVNFTPKDGATTAMRQGGLPLGSVVNVDPLDFNETSFPFNKNVFGAGAGNTGTYDGGPIDTIWLYEEAGNHAGGGNPASADPAAVWDNFVPEPATGLILGIATMLVGFRRR